jgi:molybdopterin synthase catalytic subunit
VARIHAAIVTGPIDTDGLMRRAAAHSDGAVLVFVGTVRDVNDGRPVGHLEYAAYEPMAAKELRAILGEAAGRWSLGGLAAEHRVGTLGLGEASVAIAVASPHRGDAYEASRYVIEELKRRVPVWKREGNVDGEERWLDGHSPAAPVNER